MQHLLLLLVLFLETSLDITNVLAQHCTNIIIINIIITQTDTNSIYSKEIQLPLLQYLAKLTTSYSARPRSVLGVVRWLKTNDNTSSVLGLVRWYKTVDMISSVLRVVCWFETSDMISSLLSVVHWLKRSYMISSILSNDTNPDLKHEFSTADWKLTLEENWKLLFSDRLQQWSRTASKSSTCFNTINII